MVTLYFIESNSVVLFEIFDEKNNDNSEKENAEILQPNNATYLCLYESSVSLLQEKISSVFSYPKTSFVLATPDSMILSHDSPPTGSSITLRVIDTNQLLTVNIHSTSRSLLNFTLVKTATISSLLPKISHHLSLDSFYLSQHPHVIIPEADYTIPLYHFVEHARDVNLHIIDSKSVTLVHVAASDQSLLLGFPHDMPTFQMRQVISKRFPNSVAFLQGELWTKLIEDNTHSEMVANLSKSGQVNISALAISQTLIVTVASDNAEVSIYVHPDLVIYDMFTCMVPAANSRYKYSGPTGDELDSYDLELRVRDYVANSELGDAPLVFRMAVDTTVDISAKFWEEVYPLEADDVAQVTTAWILTSLSRVNREISIGKCVVCSSNGIISC